MNSSTSSPRLFSRGSFLEDSRIAGVLRAETTGGLLLIVGALIAIVWANTPFAGTYEAIRDFKPLSAPLDLGAFTLHLDLSIGTWAADGLLAIFFFVVGLELKREFVAGDLRDPKRAALPMAAAVGGMAVPALLYLAWNFAAADGAPRGWAIPTATDIAFAVAILAVISTHLPSGLRTFLLTLAVVDDLLAITIIAIFYTEDLDLLFLALGILPILVFGFLAQKRIFPGFLLIPLALLAWVLVHESGVHATVAGVLLGFTVPVLRKDKDSDKPGLAEHLEHLVRPISAGIAVPVFAFFAAGVTVGGFSGLVDSFKDPVALGIVTGLVAGKAIGITGSTWLLSKFTKADLDDDLAWIDVIGLSMLAGIGFTVSLLIGELAFGQGSERDDHVKVGVLIGSALAVVLATIVLRSRNRVYKKLWEAEQVDTDRDDIPDVYQAGDNDPATPPY
ncbi:Na(+)/H(+) antiporter NhaA [Nocardioides dokdonensis FR1436]|uniref:Na(+)/H(+) antiporter NhaA n=1 Tax=Nocardioides dokdonensis FR1436 TaxID=1300347 RepID=A0A1A9GIS8_9ACTN|nr:Na+/H+ antiporter NhaA [Nocardioides dokdonensis]ANH37986.1 Na(+)/H(+) antiporter NhaA [Nocardioides dokdonensis FR1436]